MAPIVTQSVDLRITQLEESLQKQLRQLEKSIRTSLQSNQTIEPNQDIESEHTSLNQVGFEAPHRLRHPLAQGNPSEILGPAFRGGGYAPPERKTNCSSQSLLPDFEYCCVAGSAKTHTKTCIYSFRNKTRRTLAGKIKVYNYIFTYKIMLQFPQHSFPRDFEVYPNFTVRATCQSSPAFELVARCSERVRQAVTMEELRNDLKSCLINVRQCFLDGRAWPTDVTPFGMNLLHVCGQEPHPA